MVSWVQRQAARGRARGAGQARSPSNSWPMLKCEFALGRILLLKVALGSPSTYLPPRGQGVQRVSVGPHTKKGVDRAGASTTLPVPAARPPRRCHRHGRAPLYARGGAGQSRHEESWRAQSGAGANERAPRRAAGCWEAGERARGEQARVRQARGQTGTRTDRQARGRT